MVKNTANTIINSKSVSKLKDSENDRLTKMNKSAIVSQMNNERKLSQSYAKY